MKPGLEAYLSRLGRELRRRGLFDSRIVEEARGHLLDSTEQGIKRGLLPEAAEREAIARFGPPETIAGTFASEKSGVAKWLLFIRRALFGTVPPDHNRLVFHDKSAPRFHFVVKSRRGWVNPEHLAIASDPNTQLVPFLERVAPAPLGPLGQPQSVTLLEAESTKGIRKYRVVFGREVKTVCTVILRSDGRGVSLDWSRPATV
jgi:HAAS domain-containing protein